MAALTEAAKRTTILVRDLKRSLEFYRDILGWDVFYEGDVDGEGVSQLMGMPCTGVKMVVLNAHGSQFGNIGLMEVKNAAPPLENPTQTGRIRYGEAALVIGTQNILELHEKIAKAGYTVINPPAKIGVPGRPMAVLEMFVRDPDGVLVNLTQRVAA
ncbi:MAG: VOC family protein [Rhodospirillaceae bacterium]|nr:VOC family protein [Rhodospirillaceae bacterium]